MLSLLPKQNPTFREDSQLLNDCRHSFQNKKRARKDKNGWLKKAYYQYAVGRQTLENLSEVYGKSTKTLQRAFNNACFVTGEIRVPDKPSPAIMDATLILKEGMVCWLARTNGRNIMWREVKTEKIEDYEKLAHMLMDTEE